MTHKGLNVLADSLRAVGVDCFFYLIGGPMTQAMEATVAAGARGIDVRDERAATFAAIAYSRLRRRPGVVMSCSGPGTTNTVTGVSHAFADGSPVVVLGGSSPMYQRGTGAFQETDQLSLMRPITKWAHQVQCVRNIPDAVVQAMHVATSGAPGPVYLDLPADVLYEDTDLDVSTLGLRPHTWPVRSLGDPTLVSRAAAILRDARRPVLIAGSGVHWSDGGAALREFVDLTGIPFFTTPMARGLVPESHPLALRAARTAAFRDADCLVVVGTRVNYVVSWLQSPVMDEDASVVELNIDASALSHTRQADVAIQADARLGLEQLTRELTSGSALTGYADWVQRLRDLHEKGRERAVATETSPETPIHPLRLCAELDRLVSPETVVVVDGHEILGFSRRGMTAHTSGRTLTPGAYGTMGVGVAFGIGARAAEDEAPVVVLTGDGAFGYHAMELDTAVRHGMGLVVVISNNAGWTGARDGRAGRSLEQTDYHRLADVFGCFGERVDDPEAIAGALARAFEYARVERKPAIVNVTVSTAQNAGRTFIHYQSGGGASEYGPA